MMQEKKFKTNDDVKKLKRKRNRMMEIDSESEMNFKWKIRN